jgi:hypothetical protein
MELIGNFSTLSGKSAPRVERTYRQPEPKDDQLLIDHFQNSSGEIGSIP